MLKWMKKSSHKTALAPGALIYVGDRPDSQIGFRTLTYNREQYSEKKPATVEEAFDVNRQSICWTTVSGVHDSKVITYIGEHEKIHHLVLEDIMHTGQRPKIEIFEDYIFIIVNLMTWAPEERAVKAEQLSMIVKENRVIMLRENTWDYDEPIRERIKNTRWRERQLGSDYLAYAIVDVVVDHYFAIFENISGWIEQLEEKINRAPLPEVLEEIHQLKGQLAFMKKAVWPLRELVSKFSKSDNHLIGGITKEYSRDLYDHVIQAIDTLETLKELVSGLQELYMSSMSNKMNEVMKVLTIIATLFIPPTFIAGIYGMNFELMPELKWPWGYAMALTVMLIMVIAMLVMFRRKKWF